MAAWGKPNLEVVVWASLLCSHSFCSCLRNLKCAVLGSSCARLGPFVCSLWLVLDPGEPGGSDYIESCLRQSRWEILAGPVGRDSTQGPEAGGRRDETWGHTVQTWEQLEAGRAAGKMGCLYPTNPFLDLEVFCLTLVCDRNSARTQGL